MIKAEMNYNPYLRETKIQFNGQEPKVNSLVEKYENEILQDWISEVPRIFYDEMNGYDFELEFAGTELDFHELQQVFWAAGVDETQVKISNKNELDDRKIKENKVKELFQWLGEKLNRKFDYEEFKNQHQDLFYGSFTFILVQGRAIDLSVMNQIDISIESIESADEVANTDLSNSPIIFYVNKDNLTDFQKNLKAILSREEIHQNQLFFLIQSSSDQNKIERLIRDLGVREPQIIHEIDDAIVQRYLEVFPLTDYINRSIIALRNEVSRIADILNTENEENEISNREIYAKLDELDACLDKLKNTEGTFAQRDKLDMPVTLQEAKDKLYAAILNWRSRKIKITKDDEAVVAAQQFEAEVMRLYDEYVENARTILEETRNDINISTKGKYEGAELDTNYAVHSIRRREVLFANLPPIAAELLKLKEERYIEKSAFLDKFFKPNEEEAIESVLEISYAYEDWRKYVLKVVEPIAENIYQDVEDVLSGYYEELSEGYLNHIRELIVLKKAEREKVAAQLTDEGQALQDDNEWLTEFDDQLKSIERD